MVEIEDGTLGTEDPAADADAATGEEGTEQAEEDKDKYEYRTIKTTVRIPANKKPQLRALAEEQVKRRASSLGFPHVGKVKLDQLRCDDTNCTTTATATAHRLKSADNPPVPKDAEEGEETPQK